MEQEKKLCDKVEAIQESTYLVDSVSAGGGCEAAVIARTICGWVKLRECVELLYGWRFPLRLKWAVYESYVRPAILYGSEASEVVPEIKQNGNFTKDRLIHGDVCCTAQRSKKIYGVDVGFE